MKEETKRNINWVLGMSYEQYSKLSDKEQTKVRAKRRKELKRIGLEKPKTKEQRFIEINKTLERCR